MDQEILEELQTSEYLVFLLALDTYFRYLGDAGLDPRDPHMIAGIKVLRQYDSAMLPAVVAHFTSLLPTDGQKKMVQKGASLTPDRVGLPKRALYFRTALERGGAATVSALYKTNKYKAAVRQALAASVNENADAALDVFASINLPHARLEAWIKEAARLAVPNPMPANPVTEATTAVVDNQAAIVEAQVKGDASDPTSATVLDAKAAKDAGVASVQATATEKAREAIAKSGEADVPPTKSEVIGLTAAMIAAQKATGDENLPPAIKRLRDPQQRDVAMSTGRVVVQATAGAGKCIAGSTLVRTSEGWIPIQEFADGLNEESTSPLNITIQGKDGLESTSFIYRDGLRPTIRVTTRYGYSIEGTGKHPILVLRGGEIQWVKLSDMEEGDFVCIDRRPALFSEVPYRVSAVKHPDARRTPCNLPLELNRDVASLLGYIVSEGSFSFRHGVQLTTNDADQQSLYTGCLNSCSVPYSTYVDKRNGVVNTSVSSKNYLEGFTRYGLYPALAHEKCVPEGIFRSPKPVVRSFLRALFDGDGSATDLQVSYASASPVLARQVHELLLGFGVISKLRFKPNPKKGCWHIDITGDSARLFFKEVGFNLRSKQAKESVFETRSSNTNIDVVPGVKDLFWAVREEIRGQMSFTKVERYGAFNSVMGGVREPSRKTIRNFLESTGCTSQPAKNLLALADSPWFFDPVVSLDKGEAEVYDFVVPGTHSFSAGGFVNHNTSAVVGMLQYLVQDKGVPPERIFVAVFNRKAADTIKERVLPLLGDETVKSMKLGTMHSRFRDAIIKYGHPALREAFQKRLIAPPSEENPRPFITPGQLNGVMVALWKGIYGDTKPLPKSVDTALQKWKFNDVSPANAMKDALDANEESQAIWYEWEKGFKGFLGPNWTPPGLALASDKAKKKWNEFINKYRSDEKTPRGSKVLVDFTDMIIQFRNVLRDSPQAKAEVQSQYDYIIYDEAQDLAKVNHQIADGMSEHIGVDDKDKLLMFIGDTCQAINLHVGGSPKHMEQRYTDGFKLKTIKTNHRSLPEIVEAGQRLLSNHPKNIPFEAQPDPEKPRGQASIIVKGTPDQAIAAQDLAQRWQSEMAMGDKSWSDYAVLSRTRRELDTYELSCIVNGIPYTRKGGSSFLQSPEMNTVTGYLNLCTSQDYSVLKTALSKVLNTPSRFYLGTKKPDVIIDQAVQTLARSSGVSTDAVNPLDLLTSSRGAEALLDSMYPDGLLFRMERDRSEAWKIKKAREAIVKMGHIITSLRDDVATKGTPGPDGTVEFSTERLLEEILAIPGEPETRDSTPPTVRDVLIPPMRKDEDEESGAEVTDPEEAALGTVYFLKVLANDGKAIKEAGLNPAKPDDFISYLSTLDAQAKDLRIDPKKWDKEQVNLFPNNPEMRKKVPAVTLSTVHSMKGAEFDDVSVVMTAGSFPMKPRRINGEDSLPPEKAEILAKRREEEFLTERQLAYVAITRASKKLTIISQTRDSKGRKIPPSSFITEAGLIFGENVKEQPAQPEEATESLRTASFYVEEW